MTASFITRTINFILITSHGTLYPGYHVIGISFYYCATILRPLVMLRQRVMTIPRDSGNTLRLGLTKGNTSLGLI